MSNNTGATAPNPPAPASGATPQPDNVVYVERIGDTDYQLQEHQLDVETEVSLWSDNPRLIPHLQGGAGVQDERELEMSLAQTPGFGALKKSIADIGQLEPVYVWKGANMNRYLVLEGSTRVTILRELAREEKGTPNDGRHRKIRAKVLPPTFPMAHRVILLARIHVRGSGVRSWGRYIEAKFIHEATEGARGEGAVLSISDLASWMGKSISWVSRLRDAYKFALQFVEHIDEEGVNAHELAAEYFSTLEEIIKSAGFGPRLKGPSQEAEELRGDVFNMVTAGVFKEYRDARYMREFYQDAEKWELLKSHEKEIAHRLANEIKAGNSTAKARIHSLHDQISRTFAADGESIGESELEELHKCVGLVESQLAADLGIFRLKARKFSQDLTGASLGDVLSLTPDEFRGLQAGMNDLEDRIRKHSSWYKAGTSNGAAPASS